YSSLKSSPRFETQDLGILASRVVQGLREQDHKTCSMKGRDERDCSNYKTDLGLKL
ncbi:hypothetical protein R6Q59_030125, partial [Mikania micrantha]